MADAMDKHLEAALKWLDRAALSRRRLTEKMLKAGWSEAETRRVAAKLEAMGVVNDEAMGRALIEELRTRRAARPAMLRVKLLQRGLDEALVERLLEESGDDPLAAARDLVRQKLRSLARLDPNTRKRRLWGLLARKGYDRDAIERALAEIAELWEANDGDDLLE